MTPAKLRSRYREVLKRNAPDISPGLLRHAIAYRLQERQHGKLPLAQAKAISRLQTKLLEQGSIKPASAAQLSSGTQLLRKWNHAMHVVLVLDDGFEYDGRRYSSLTQIAQSITGAHWSGPRFFGLTRKTGAGVHHDQ